MKLRRWVVKVGSQMVCTGGPVLIRGWMHQVANLRKNEGIEVIWVTSGAIASAVERTGFSNLKLLPEKQALSAIGQPLLMDLYNLSLQSVGLIGAQILLTYADMEDPERHKNLENTLEKLLEWKALPILNENDTVATEEIKFGDNDSLSAKVAILMKAECLVVLTDVEGLYTDNPTTNSSVTVVNELPEVTDEWLAKLKGATTSQRGTGGMYSKLLAAKLAAEKGINTWLVKGDTPNILTKIAKDEKVGTRIGKKK